jgi:hypothetical protein
VASYPGVLAQTASWSKATLGPMLGGMPAVTVLLGTETIAPRTAMSPTKLYGSSTPAG